MHGSSPGAQSPLARSSLGKPAGSAWLRGLLAEIVVPLAWQNHARLVQPHQGHVCQQWCCAFVGTASIFRVDGVFIEPAAAWVGFALCICWSWGLCCRSPVCSALTHAWCGQPESLPGNSGGTRRPVLPPVISPSPAPAHCVRGSGVGSGQAASGFAMSSAYPSVQAGQGVSPHPGACHRHGVLQALWQRRVPGWVSG